MFSFFASLLSNSQAKDTPGRSLKMEPLERREMLSAAGLVDVGAQPEGGLDGKIVYVHAGHGYTANGSGWGYQRPLLLDMVEDLGNQDQMTFLVDYLWNAGATVVPLRPVGNQLNEVVIENNDAGATFSGSWGVGAGSIYYGSVGEDPYRFATTSATETAVATYRPDLPESGFYPVYTWATAGTNRATDQLYRVHHSGGATEVTVDHSRVGNGLVYLGTFHFEEGTEGYVEISNRSSEAGKVVIADMIRFGNGVGDINRGNGVSGQSRENEAGLYWVEWHVDRSQGIPTSAYRVSSSDSSATVSLSPRYATFMNQGAVGTLSDRVFVSFHSNAGGGSSRGVLALLNGNNRASAATPNQFLLANTLGRQVNDDLVAQNGSFEHNWFNRSVVTLDRSDIEFGEINNERINGEFDATIVETGFHDNTQDAQMLRDPRVRDAIAKATYQGVVDYFNSVDGGATLNLDAPARVTELTAESTAAGAVTLSWQPGAANSFAGGAPTGYMVFASTDGYRFDGGTHVAGGGTTTTTLTGLDPVETYYFKIVAENAAGFAHGSEVVAAKPSGAAEKVLIVNGFDRIDRNLVTEEPFPSGGLADRVRPRNANSFDYSVQVASALKDAGSTAEVSTAANEDIASGDVDLSDYDAVFWILGEESTNNDTFNAQEQAEVQQYLSAGGKLFLSGAEIGWDLDNLNNGRSFYNNTLRADYVSDDAGTYNVTGAAGSIFAGLSFTFDDGTQFYNAEFPDVINPFAGSTAALTYDGGTGGTAGVQYTDGATGEQLVMLGFPFETITEASDRADAMAVVLDYFGLDANPPQVASVILDNDDGAPTYTETGFWITNASDPGFEGGTQRFNLIGFDGTATWESTLPFGGEAEAFVQFDADTNRATSVAYTVTHPGGSFSATVNQRLNDFEWVSLGTFDTTAGPVSITVDALNSTGPSNSIVIADVARFDVRSTAASPNGDFNADGTVDAADYTVWRDTRGASVTPGDGADADLSGTIDQGDYDIWVATFGQTVSSSSAASSQVVAPQLISDPSETVTPNGQSLASFFLLRESLVARSVGDSIESELDSIGIGSTKEDLLVLAEQKAKAAFANEGDEPAVTSQAESAQDEAIEHGFAQDEALDSLKISKFSI